jgi:zinc protease
MKKMNLNLLFGFLLLTLLPLAGFGQGNRIEFTEFKLGNSLHVILHQDNSTPNVVVNIMYHVGAKNDFAGSTGFAHFFEHLMFEGAQNIGRGEFSEIVEKAGGELNAWTNFDITNYYVYLPSNQLELGLWLESERLLHPVIDSIGIATQKSVVTEEMKQTRDNRPYGRLLAETLKRAYTVHPYKSDVIGLDEHIRGASKDDIQAFHDMYYVPNNAVLVIAGDIDVAKTRVLVEKYFGDIPAGRQKIVRPKITEPVKTVEVRDSYQDNIQLPAIIHAYPLPPVGSPDFYAMDMLSTLLSDGQSSRMYKKLVDEEQTALTVQAIPLALEDPGLKIVFGIPNMGIEPETLEKGIDAELDKVKNELISEMEYQKLLNQKESDLVNSNTGISSRASSLANYHTLYKDADMINKQFAKYQSVTREDIQRVANKYLKKEGRMVLYYMPKTN